MDTENVFIEIISQLCFGGYGDPKEAVIKTLFSTIFLDKSSTDVIDPETYTIPAIHSFLLKLLMDHKYVTILTIKWCYLISCSSEQVKTYLQGYLQKLKRGCTVAEQNVCLMTMQCLEVCRVYNKYIVIDIYCLPSSRIPLTKSWWNISLSVMTVATVIFLWH